MVITVLAADAAYICELTTALALAIACAVLSVFVVSRRWAFIGEGIGHSGFGGAGTVWLIAAFVPAVDHAVWAPYAGVIVVSLATAWAIAFFTRSGKLNSDAVIGIFLAAMLAWGILAQQLYMRRLGHDPIGWNVFLFGHMADVAPMFAAASVVLCAAVIGTIILLEKEILAYCFDPAIAEASGVRVGFIHYLLLLLIALTIVIGARVTGSVLVPALLVLPGATALVLARRLRTVMAGSVAVALLATAAGIAAGHWSFLPAGPVIVLAMFVQFVLAFSLARLRSV